MGETGEPSGGPGADGATAPETLRHPEPCRQDDLERGARRGVHRRGKPGRCGGGATLSGTVTDGALGPGTGPSCARHEASTMPHIAVIGAGITGVTTAYALAERGYDVTVFDQHRYAGMETSFANGGQLSASNAEVWNKTSTILQGLKWMTRRDAPLLVNPKPVLAQVFLDGRVHRPDPATTGPTRSRPSGSPSRPASTWCGWPSARASSSTSSAAASCTSTGTSRPTRRPRR